MPHKWTNRTYTIKYKDLQRSEKLAAGLTEKECDTWIHIEAMTSNDRQSWVNAYLKLLYQEIELLEKKITCLKQN
jgi:hypothetical protein